jgi:hypothetical protein
VEDYIEYWGMILKAWLLRVMDEIEGMNKIEGVRVGMGVKALKGLNKEYRRIDIQLDKMVWNGIKWNQMM